MEIQIGSHSQGGRDFNLRSSFSKEILDELVPSRFKMPIVKSFDGSIDPLDDLESFRAIIRL